MSEATIDELRIEIESDAQSAAGGLDSLIQRLDRLRSAVAGVTNGNGLQKIAKQISKIKEATQQIQGLTGFDNITKLAGSLSTLGSVGGNSSSNVNALVRSLKKIAEVVPTINALPNINTAKIGMLGEAVAPLQGTNVSAVNSFLNALKKIPKIANDLSAVDMDKFAGEMERLAAAMRPLAEEINQVAAGFSAMPARLQRYITQMESANSGTGTGGGLRGLGSTLGALRTKTIAAYAALAQLYSKLADCVNISSQYVENLNLFRVTIGESADEAYRFAEAVNEAMGIDVSDWVRYQGFFQSIAKGFGIVSEKADLMSQNLTQLSYDISSFYNASVEEAYNKVVSGLSGELEPLRRYGFALDEATLKQLALEKGITQSVESMTQAQKAQLRYVAILEQAGNIGILGDMSRNIDTPANQLRMLSARLTQFARAVGNMLLPILSQVLPYLTAFVQILTDAAQTVANFLGFELPKIDISTTGITGGYDDITAATEAATAATEKFKGSLAGVDQLNIIGSKSDGETGAGSGSIYDLDIELPTYDFLNGVESKVKDIYESMKQGLKELLLRLKELLPDIVAVGASLAAIFVGSKIAKLVSYFKGLTPTITKLGEWISTHGGSKLFGLVGGLTAGAASGLILYNSIKKLITGTGSLGLNIGTLVAGITAAGGAITAFIALGNPVGAVITGIGAAAGVLLGVISGVNEKIEAQNKIIADNILYNNGGTKITAIADAFEKWAGAATDLNNQTIEKYQQLDTYNDKIDATLTTMQEITGIDFNFDEITPADAEALKAPFEELAGYLQDEFKERTKLVAQDLQSAFANLGVESAVSVQVQQAYAEMQRTFDENLSESQKTVDKYLDILSAGGTLTTAQQEEFLNDYNYIIDSARGKDTSYMEVQRALADIQNMDLTTVDLESDTAAQDAINRVFSTFSAYVASADKLYEQEIANLDQLRYQAKTDYDYGNIDLQTYNDQLALLDAAEYIFGMNYNQTISDIKAQVEPILSAINQEFAKASLGVDANVWEYLVAGAYTGSLGWLTGSAQELAQQLATADWLEDNELYQLFKEGEAGVNATLTVDIDATYDPNGPFAFIYESLQGKTNNGKFGYHGDNSQYKTDFAVAESVKYEYEPYAWKPSRSIQSVITPTDYDAISRATAAYESGAFIKTPTYTAKKTDASNLSIVRDAMQEVGGLGFEGDDEREINITLYSTVEMDGDAVGESVSRYNSRLAYVSNGR